MIESSARGLLYRMYQTQLKGHMTHDANYVTQLQKDRAEVERYYLGGLQTKTEQQKFLEELVESLPCPLRLVADIACGAGTASYHLSQKLPDAHFELVDQNPDAVLLAQRVMNGRPVRVALGDVYKLDLPSSTFDLVVCWQTLLALDTPAVALRELVRIARKGGTIFASSLFNLSSDVDILARVIDWTRPSGQTGGSYTYNTYSRRTVETWFADLDCKFEIHPFDISIDVGRSGRGIGTFTETLMDGRRLQISGGMLMNWGVLQVTKNV